MKVLFCSPLGNVGGISRWTQHILNYYRTNNSDIELVQYYGTKNSGSHTGDSFLARVYRGACKYIPLYRSVKKRICQERFDILHLCSSASISLLKDIFILRCAKKRGLKTILHFHFGRIPDLFVQKNWEYKLLIRAISYADKVIVIDHKSYDTLIQAGYKNIEFLPNPLSPAIDDIIRDNKDVKKDLHKIVFAGHVIPTKGVFELVEACKQIPDIKVRMLGFVSDEMRTKLRQTAGENSESWLDIAGEQTYEATVKEMLSAGMFVLPTYTEGFPNVILESMACACPIVTTDVGAIPEMLDIANGFEYGICVKPMDVEALKKAIEKMLNQPEYALLCGLNAQRRVKEQYSMPIVGSKLTTIWSSLK